MKDNILCFSSYKLRKEKKAPKTSSHKEPPPPPEAAPEQVTLQILKLRKSLDALHALVEAL